LYFLSVVKWFETDGLIFKEETGALI